MPSQDARPPFPQQQRSHDVSSDTPYSSKAGHGRLEFVEQDAVQARRRFSLPSHDTRRRRLRDRMQTWALLVFERSSGGRQAVDGRQGIMLRGGSGSRRAGARDDNGALRADSLTDVARTHDGFVLFENCQLICFILWTILCGVLVGAVCVPVCKVVKLKLVMLPPGTGSPALPLATETQILALASPAGPLRFTSFSSDGPWPDVVHLNARAAGRLHSETPGSARPKPTTTRLARPACAVPTPFTTPARDSIPGASPASVSRAFCLSPLIVLSQSVHRFLYKRGARECSASRFHQQADSEETGAESTKQPWVNRRRRIWPRASPSRRASPRASRSRRASSWPRGRTSTG